MNVGVVIGAVIGLVLVYLLISRIFRLFGHFKELICNALLYAHIRKLARTGEPAKRRPEPDPVQLEPVTPQEKGTRSVKQRNELITAGAIGLVLFIVFLFFHIVIYGGGITFIPKRIPNFTAPIVCVDRLIEEWNQASYDRRLRLMGDPNFSHLMNELERRGIIKFGR